MSIKEAIMILNTPNEFELYEFFEDHRSGVKLPNNSISSIRKHLNALIRKREVVEGYTNSKKYPRRYCMATNRPYCKLEPAILRHYRSIVELMRYAKDVLKNGDKCLPGDIKLIRDPLRDIVIAIKDNFIMGVIDLRYRSNWGIRLPTRFYARQVDHHTYQGMSELQYFSRLVNKICDYPKGSWLSVACWGF